MRTILLLALTFAFASCQKDDDSKKNCCDFESLMGKDLPAWEYVKTKEDFNNLSYFKKLYEDNLTLLTAVPKKEKIPKVLHFIWIGPKQFPRESVENVRSWIAKNPDWVVKFWTDRDRPLPHPSMKKMMIKDFNFLKLADCYHKSDNFGEKSDLLRYEILFQEGGVYVDHDVKCMKSFDACNNAYDLYCGLEVPYKTSLSTSVSPTNNILGSRPAHPVLLYSMEWLIERWDQIEKDYPGKDRDSVINRVSHRTFYVLGEALKVFGNKGDNHDMIFPAYYFNAPKESQAIMARHTYQGTWFENESQFEKMARERLMMLSKKTNKILLFFGIMSVLHITGFVVLFYTFRKKSGSAAAK